MYVCIGYLNQPFADVHIHIVYSIYMYSCVCNTFYDCVPQPIAGEWGPGVLIL